MRTTRLISTAVTSGVVCMGMALLALGCATTFMGSPMFPGGARGCFERCHAEHMEMASFVYVGEYSTACACRTLGPGAAAASIEGGIVAATAGVETQRQQAAQQQQMHH
jgi:hypothetical protein